MITQKKTLLDSSIYNTVANGVTAYTDPINTSALDGIVTVALTLIPGENGTEITFGYQVGPTSYANTFVNPTFNKTTGGVLTTELTLATKWDIYEFIYTIPAASLTYAPLMRFYLTPTTEAISTWLLDVYWK